jgi:tetratricopeptide (TPR) repeat protein
MKIHQALQHSSKAVEFLEKKDFAKADEEYQIQKQLAPDYVELDFWYALGLYTAGQEEKALDLFREVFRKEGLWVKVIDTLPASGLLPADAAPKIKAVAGK